MAPLAAEVLALVVDPHPLRDVLVPLMLEEPGCAFFYGGGERLEVAGLGWVRECAGTLSRDVACVG